MKPFHKNSVVVMIVLAFFVTACGGGAEDFTEIDGFVYGEDEAYNAPALGAPAEAQASKQSLGVLSDNGGNFNEGDLLPNQENNRIILKNADLSLVVKDPTDALRQITSIADGLGGFIVSSNLYQTFTPDGQQVPGATVTIRVPSENFVSVLEQLENGAIEV
ncbi:MAG: DUF4349 domain-containing protein, partial [Chloroflexota bacterium]